MTEHAEAPTELETCNKVRSHKLTQNIDGQGPTTDADRVTESGQSKSRQIGTTQTGPHGVKD